MSIFLELFKRNSFLTIYIHISKSRNSVKKFSIDQIFFFYMFRTFQLSFFVHYVVFKCQYFWSYSRKKLISAVPSRSVRIFLIDLPILWMARPTLTCNCLYPLTQSVLLLTSRHVEFEYFNRLEKHIKNWWRQCQIDQKSN